MVAVFPGLASRKSTKGRPAVNPLTKPPSSPGAWIDDRRCICGERYHDFRSSIRHFVNAVAAYLTESGDRELYRSRGHGVFISRGPVLFYWRCLKLSEWYEEHYPCGSYRLSLDDLDESDFDTLDDLLAAQEALAAADPPF